MKKILFAALIVIATATFAFADTIYLRDGRIIHGTLLGFINGHFVVRVEPRYSTLPSTTNDPNVARNRTNQGDIQYYIPKRSRGLRSTAARSMMRATKCAPSRSIFSQTGLTAA